jgi:hypothetical protein
MIACDHTWRRFDWIALRCACSLLASLLVAIAGDVGPRHTDVLAQELGWSTVSTAREIDDPFLGTRWVWIRDLNHPGAPARLVCVQSAHRDSQPASPGTPRGKPLVPQQILPVIRSGDALIVEDDNPIANARLQAVALGPAAVGSVFEAKLKIGQRPIKVIALASGRAKFAPQFEVRP